MGIINQAKIQQKKHAHRRDKTQQFNKQETTMQFFQVKA